MSRFVIRPQKWSERHPHDDGFALIDTAERRQVGWFVQRDRAEARAAERNREEAQAPTPADAPQFPAGLFDHERLAG
jgi:hypothetical protein